MAKITNPIRFSDQFKLKPGLLESLGSLDPTLNADTRLFMDPMLLSVSRHREMRSAKTAYDAHFASIIKFLRLTKSQDDVAWKSAYRCLSFPEIKWTCLGYGGQSVVGSGAGDGLTMQVIDTARQIVALGVDDPDLFVSMALFEPGFGPDRISDMTANVILNQLLQFNERVLQNLSVPRQSCTLQLRNGNSYTANLPINPYAKTGTPIILVPSDILRDLPIASDWADIADAATQNAVLRSSINADIAKLWQRKTLKEKEALRKWALSGKTEFQQFLELIRNVERKPYNTALDPRGELFWRNLLRTIAKEEPFEIKPPALLDLDGVASVVEQIIAQFKFLVEDRRFSEELYIDDRPRPEKAAQRLFFAVACSYCKANNLDLTPEAETGNGPVDFKVASGFSGRVLVEIKLSTNKKVIRGYTEQLGTYKAAEETAKGYYIVIDVGQMGKKHKVLMRIKNELIQQSQPASEIYFIDGSRRPSASKL